MGDTPFRCVWYVDQQGYEIEHVKLDGRVGLGMVREYDAIRPIGGPHRSYWPLEEDGLWLQFANVCKTAEGVLSFVKQFGLLTGSPPERLDSFLGIAALIRQIGECLEAGERVAATKLFASSGLPTMKGAVFWYGDRPKVFEFRYVPLTLRDVLLHQTGEAITGNRRFRRCRNEGCPKWFRLGPQSRMGERARTFTARREFCSDRCRVAFARRQKKAKTANG